MAYSYTIATAITTLDITPSNGTMPCLRTLNSESVLERHNGPNAGQAVENEGPEVRGERDAGETDNGANAYRRYH